MAKPSRPTRVKAHLLIHCWSACMIPCTSRRYRLNRHSVMPKKAFPTAYHITSWNCLSHSAEVFRGVLMKQWMSTIRFLPFVMPMPAVKPWRPCVGITAMPCFWPWAGAILHLSVCLMPTMRSIVLTTNVRWNPYASILPTSIARKAMLPKPPCTITVLCA